MRPSACRGNSTRFEPWAGNLLNYECWRKSTDMTWPFVNKMPELGFEHPSLKTVQWDDGMIHVRTFSLIFNQENMLEASPANIQPPFIFNTQSVYIAQHKILQSGFAKKNQVPEMEDSRNLIAGYFWGRFSLKPYPKPYPYGLHRWGFLQLHFRYLKCLVTDAFLFKDKSIHWNPTDLSNQPIQNLVQASTAVGPCGCFSPLTSRRPWDPGSCQVSWKVNLLKMFFFSLHGISRLSISILWLLQW